MSNYKARRHLRRRAGGRTWSQVHHNVCQVVTSGKGQEGRILFSRAHRLHMGEVDGRALLRATLRAVEVSVVAVDARSEKRLPA